MVFRPALVLAVLAAFTVAPSQSPPLGLTLVDGGMYARAILSADGKRLEAHVQIDLSSTVALRLHSNSADVLELSPDDPWVTVTIDGHELGSYFTEVQRLRGLEQVTAEHAPELDEVPAVAILGWPAFAKLRTRFDLPRRRFQVQEALIALPADAPSLLGPADVAAAAVELPIGARLATALLPGSIPTIELFTENGAPLKAALGTAGTDTWIEAARARSEGAADGALKALRLGALDLTRYAALRPGDRPGQLPERPAIILGTGFLARTSFIVDGPRARVDFTLEESPLDPAVDRALFSALAKSDSKELERWLNENTAHRLAEETAGQLLQQRFQDRSGGPVALEEAVLLRVRTAPARRRARTAMDLAGRLREADEDVFRSVRKPLFELALEASAQDENAETVHKVRSEIGAIYLEAGDLDEAWKHLLGAAFGLPRDGLVNLRLGRLYERQGRFERAWSRYLQAAVTADGGAEGLSGLKRLAREQNLKTPFDPREMKRALEGRVPAFEPASRHQVDPAAPPSRRVLVELFTGAECPPCFAADLAVDGAMAHFGPHAILLQHHLPIPAPEPLVSPAAVQRAERLGIQGTPTVVLDGRVGVADVGGRTMQRVEPSFRALKTAIEQRLSIASPFALTVTPSAAGRVVRAEIVVDGPAASGHRLVVYLVERAVLYPGANKIVWHHEVVRADLSAGGFALDAAAGPRSFRVERDLDALGVELEDFLGRQFGEEAFALMPLDLPLSEMGFVLVLFDSEGRAIQAAHAPVLPRTAEEEG